MRKLRQNHTEKAKKIASWTGDHFATVTASAKAGLTIASQMHKVLGTNKMRKLTQKAYQLSGHKIPQWTPHLPLPAAKIIAPNGITKERVVYFPSCAARNMGVEVQAKDKRPLAEVTMSLLEKAGYEVILPADLNNQCCGMPYTSKGFPETAHLKAQQLERVLWEASEQGQYPILMDTSPCASTSKQHLRKELTIYEPFQFVAEFVFSRLEIIPQQEPVMLHITCTSRRQGLAPLIEQVTKACAPHVIIPDDISCCGFAGDKGFTKPELNASALAPLKAQVPAGCSEGYSNSRTCEIGLSEHSGIEYRSILYLVDKVSHRR